MKTVEAVATAIERRLQEKYGYAPAPPGSFGHTACRQGAIRIVAMLDENVRDRDFLAVAAHLGWADVVHSFDDPVYKTNPAKKDARLKLATTLFKDLSDEEKEKDYDAADAAIEEYDRKPETVIVGLLQCEIAFVANRLAGERVFTYTLNGDVKITDTGEIIKVIRGNVSAADLAGKIVYGNPTIDASCETAAVVKLLYPNGPPNEYTEKGLLDAGVYLKSFIVRAEHPDE